MSEEKNLLEVSHLKQYFPVHQGFKTIPLKAVDDISFAIKPGETLGLVGESGCGKTTVGRTLLRLYQPTAGRIVFDGKVLFDSGEQYDENGKLIVDANGKPVLGKKVDVDMLPYRRQMQMVFQDPYSSLNPRMTVEDIIVFADEVDLNDVRAPIARQIEYNTAIAEAGLTGQYGAAIGKILLDSYGDSVQNRAKAWAAAGSDARMNGCEKPVVINSGSGNQGMTASLPVIVYARELKASEEQLYRALVVSNLVTIHLKTGIGSLSAYCGATSAGAGAGAGICYLYGGRYDEIAHTVVNALAINSGMLCDGAKASCAAKIASAVEAGLLGMQMYRHDSQFYGGDGIVVKGVENTIRAVSSIARDGMRETDNEIIRLMIGEETVK